LAWRAIFGRNRNFAVIDELTGQGRAVMNFTRAVSSRFSARRRNAIGASDGNTIPGSFPHQQRRQKAKIAFWTAANSAAQVDSERLQAG
jgi:hypothetical protein